MSRLPRLVGGVGAGLSRLADRLEARKGEDPGAAETPAPVSPVASGPEPVPAAAPVPAADPAGQPPAQPTAEHVPPPPGYAPAVAARPDPVATVPWGVRVAAEVAWRLLILAGTLWVLMRVISAVQLVVLAFTAALLITALLQPTVALLKRRGVPRGLATAMTFISGFVVMGLVGWFVVWQVTENLDDLSTQVQQGIKDLKHWLLNSPFHVTEDQINNIADNLSQAIGTNTKDITSAGIEGVQVIIEVLTGILLAMFSTLFLLYDGPKIWEWLLKLFPAAAREGVAGAGPRAWATLTAYVRGTVIVALIDAIFIGIGLFFLDVPLAVPLAVFIFLFAFIPLVGAVVSGALAVVVALVTRDVFTAMMVLVVVLAVQQIEGHVLQPFILGRAVRVHPLAVVLSVAAGSLIAGIGGAVVAVPLAAVTNTVVGYLRAHAKENALRAAAADGPRPEESVTTAARASAAGAMPPGEPPGEAPPRT
ncbi:membrane protein [Streptomyces eurocidicus]|uniref:Membrane protein n=1 Tax=Streptomyces eurocidicus TaxID=66423 RepID=A0A2N8NRP2_STREU|nr:AI-2E family transporter [Streptomyces eurocidicus]MBB5117263.1 putative PurR-regulated permease PerM [Streptomyces eurocidicus]MBF6052447.1 AI-2E family transporter [Streptomyces eurocidicus]PNE31437.1 membrane protein [Streptomyces eurocidicus]